MTGNYKIVCTLQIKNAKLRCVPPSPEIFLLWLALFQNKSVHTCEQMGARRLGVVGHALTLREKSRGVKERVTVITHVQRAFCWRGLAVYTSVESKFLEKFAGGCHFMHFVAVFQWASTHCVDSRWKTAEEC